MYTTKKSTKCDGLTTSTKRRSSNFLSTTLNTILPIIFIFVVVLSGPQQARLVSADDLGTDASALLAFKRNLTNLVFDERFGSWDESGPILTNTSAVCDWFGVHCIGTNRVTELRLPGVGLRGSIAASTLGRLTGLETLSLRHNALSGPLPADLTNCRSLKTLNLSSNAFSGTFFREDSSNSSSNDLSASWPGLEALDLSVNDFSGPIPSSLARLASLATLHLQGNNFSGAIPSFSQPPLEDLNLADNALEGSIPSSLAGFSADAFSGNPSLCGAPLSTQCQNVSSSPVSATSSPDSGSGSGSGSGKRFSRQSIAWIVIAIVIFFFILCVVIASLRRRKSNAPALPY